MSKEKNKVVKVNILGQDYFIKTKANPKYFKEVSKYVNDRMKEVIDSGIDKNTQQLKIAVLTCMNITDELLSFKNDNEKFVYVPDSSLAIAGCEVPANFANSFCVKFAFFLSLIISEAISNSFSRLSYSSLNFGFFNCF